MGDCDYESAAQAFAFLGNSLLSPLTQTGTYGLDPEFWKEFPVFGETTASKAVAACREYATVANMRMEAGFDVVGEVSVEFAKLFVGPPKPVAPPWETMYRESGTTVGYGQPAIAMHRALRELGLEVAGERNQYPDHLGIELLCLSEMCRKVEQGEFEIDRILAFIEDHPCTWIDLLKAKVDRAYPNGYYAHLLGVAEALLGCVRAGVLSA